MLLVLALLTSPLAAQAPPPPPEDLGLLIPAGVVARPVQDQHVLLPSTNTEGEPDVAQVYLDLERRLIVKLGNGSLRSVKRDEVTETDRPFSPDPRELEAQLAQQFPGYKIRKTRHYFCVYNADDGFRERVTTILETMYPALEKYFARQRIDVRPPDTPLVIVIFRTKADFQRYRQMPEGILAYYNTVDNRVFLYQYSQTNVNAPAIAAKQAISTIAHEGVHQILHNIGVQKRLSRWPMWISEGLAEYFSPTSTTARSKWKGVGKPNDLRMRELFRAWQQGNIGSGKQLEHLIEAQRLSSQDYALAWALTHYLASRKRRDYYNYLREVSTTPALAPPADERARFTEHFGSNFRRLEQELVKHVRGLPYTDPVLNQPYHLVSIISGNRKYAAITSSSDVDTVKAQMLRKMSPADRARARFGVRTFANRAQAEQAMALFTRSK